MPLQDWRLRVRALFAPRRVERDLDDEISFHIERETEKLIGQGLPRPEARAMAQGRFGSVLRTEDECRDARGSGFIDDTVRDIRYALRTFKRAPLVAVTIVSTVALGLGLVAVSFTILNALLFQVDAVSGVHEIFAVGRPRSASGERQGFTRAQFDALHRDTSVFTDVYAEVPQVDSRVDGRTMWGTFVTGNFFQVLGVRAAIGRALVPGDDEPSVGASVVLSHRGWDRLFARDPAVIGRRLLVDGSAFEIVGVMPEGFRGLTLAPDDYWAPLSTLGQVRTIRPGFEGDVRVDIIGRLRPGLSPQAARGGLAVWDTTRLDRAPIEGAASNITLTPRSGTIQLPPEAMLVVAPLFLAFGLILLIGCANVANLLLGRAVARQREIGIRLSLGATRRRIVRQLFTESLLLALVAATGGFAISRVVLSGVIYGMTASVPPDLGDIRLWVPDADWRVLLFLLAGAVVLTVFFGLAPALHATRIDQVATIRGDGGRDARPGWARNLLIGLQVSASALLLIGASVFLRSAFAAARFDPGIRTADTVSIQIMNETNRVAIVQAVTAEPSVAALAASWPDAPRPAFAETGDVKAAVAYKFVSPGYFSVLDVPVVRGRVFTPAEGTASLSVAIVSETAALSLWPNADAIGRVIRLDPDPRSEARSGDEPQLESRKFTVAGVVRDVAGPRIAPFKLAVVYVPTSATMPRTSLVARVHGDPELARQALLNRLTTIDPDMGRQVWTLRTLVGMETYFLRIGFWLTIVLGGLALALTLSGLFSVLSYLVEQRTREIGVRMALGATARDVTRLVLSQTIRPVGLGLATGGASAAGMAALLLAVPDAAPIGQVVSVLDPMAYILSLFAIVVACLFAASIPASRAARLDPMRTLRQE